MINAEIEASALDVLINFGLDVKAIMWDAPIQRVPTFDKPKSKNGAYRAHSDDPASVWWQNFATGEHGVWTAKSEKKLTEAERETLARRKEDTRREREADSVRHYAEAAEIAKNIYAAAASCDEHPYLARKGVKAAPFLKLHKSGALVVPAYDDQKKISTIQFIGAEKSENGRDKNFLTGGRKRGCFFPIGRPWQNTDKPLLICEGLATGLSLNECIGLPVLVAFDAGNMQHVAEIARSAFPQREIILAADNDIETEGNPGVAKASAAALAVDARIATPQLNGHKVDWNDLHLAMGAIEVKKQFESAARPESSKAAEKSHQNITNPITNSDNPEIYLQAGNRPAYLDRARAILIQAGGLYLRGGPIVRVVRYDKKHHKQRATIPDGSLHINMVKPISLAAHIERHARVLKFDKRSGEWVPSAFPDKDAAAIIEDAHESRLPFLKSIIAAPTMRPDGSILQAQGYDAQTCLYLDSGGVEFGMSKMPAKPTLNDAHQALNVLDDLIGEFPFIDRPSKSVALAAMLTALIRPTIPTAPLFCFTAPVAGSGKSKLANLVSTLATARSAAIISYTTNEEEFKKGGAALLMQGYPVNCLDNINGNLRSDWLCQVLSETEVTSRVLGESRNVTTPTTCTWIATGNNIELQEDLTRRTLRCTIDPKTDRPDARSFEFDPVKRCRDNWPRYVWAALTIMKAYHEAGRPSVSIAAYGGFEEWSNVVRSALVWAGEPDPYQNRDKLEEGDSIRQNLRGLLVAWWEAHTVVRNAGYTTGEIIKAAMATDLNGYHQEPDLLEALSEVCGDRNGKLSTRMLGVYLKRYTGRIEKCAAATGDDVRLRLVYAKGRANKASYSVQRADG